MKGPSKEGLFLWSRSKRSLRDRYVDVRQEPKSTANLEKGDSPNRNKKGPILGAFFILSNP